jgi:alpha-galactosidase
MLEADLANEYAANMANLIRDVRKDLGVPNMPVVVGQMGQDGPEATGKITVIKAAQASMETIPEFKGNVKVVKTDVFWDKKAAALVGKWRENIDEWKKVGSDYGYHYLGSAITYCKIGRAMGEAMLEMMKK